MKEDRYEFDLEEWTLDAGAPLRVILTRKKPKVDDRENTPVKVEARTWNLCEQAHHFCEYGYYYLVQFRVTGWDGVGRWGCGSDSYGCLTPNIHTQIRGRNSDGSGASDLYIGLDARDKWSAPVLLPESVHSRLDEITKALEDRANGGKG